MRAGENVRPLTYNLRVSLLDSSPRICGRALRFKVWLGASARASMSFCAKDDSFFSDTTFSSEFGVLTSVFFSALSISRVTDACFLLVRTLSSTLSSLAARLSVFICKTGILVLVSRLMVLRDLMLRAFELEAEVFDNPDACMLVRVTFYSL